MVSNCCGRALIILLIYFCSVWNWASTKDKLDSVCHFIAGNQHGPASNAPIFWLSSFFVCKSDNSNRGNSPWPCLLCEFHKRGWLERAQFIYIEKEKIIKGTLYIIQCVLPKSSILTIAQLVSKLIIASRRWTSKGFYMPLILPPPHHIPLVCLAPINSLRLHTSFFILYLHNHFCC